MVDFIIATLLSLVGFCGIFCQCVGGSAANCYNYARSVPLMLLNAFVHFIHSVTNGLSQILFGN